jgi:hypothetical protein
MKSGQCLNGNVHLYHNVVYALASNKKSERTCLTWVFVLDSLTICRFEVYAIFIYQHPLASYTTFFRKMSSRRKTAPKKKEDKIAILLGLSEKQKVFGVLCFLSLQSAFLGVLNRGTYEANALRKARRTGRVSY